MVLHRQWSKLERRLYPATASCLRYAHVRCISIAVPVARCRRLIFCGRDGSDDIADTQPAFFSIRIWNLGMMFVIEILGKPDSNGNADIIERRTHTGSTVTEALRTAQANMRTPPPSAYSFSMKANGMEVGRWQRRGEGDKANVLDDIAKAKLRADGDEF
jgi:hypothetical protein